jgi:hypothetical protein
MADKVEIKDDLIKDAAAGLKKTKTVEKNTLPDAA